MRLAKRHDEESPICSGHLINGFTQLGWKIDPVCSERDRLGYPGLPNPPRFTPPRGLPLHRGDKQPATSCVIYARQRQESLPISRKNESLPFTRTNPSSFSGEILILPIIPKTPPLAFRQSTRRARRSLVRLEMIFCPPETHPLDPARWCPLCAAWPQSRSAF